MPYIFHQADDGMTKKDENAQRERSKRAYRDQFVRRQRRLGEHLGFQ